MWEFILKYDHVISAACDIFCTGVMMVNIINNRKRILENRSRISELEVQVCPKTGKKKGRK